MTFKTTPVIFYLVLFICSVAFSQKTDYSTATISDSLSKNADAVLRLAQLDIVISSQRSMKIKSKRVVSVLNANGLDEIDANCNYNKTSPVKHISAIVYDQFGNVIKKFKKADFIDVSAAEGSTLFSDYRYLFLDYAPTTYPFTVEFELETETSNTAFIPQWMPLSAYGLSVEKSIVHLNYPSNLGFKHKELQFAGFHITKTIDTPTELAFEANNISARKIEASSPSFSNLFPRVMFGLESFHLEGVDGSAKDWTDFGKWYNQMILQGTTDLPQQTKDKIKNLVGAEIDPLKKAQIVYKYMQQKSRYVSIQVGIGGWKPMLAADVDRLGYGDCKALTNYTRALLSEVGVPAYNVIVYGGASKRNIERDFVSMQGNHMILAIPNKDAYVFLECTSSVHPFGYQGNFTDDRNVLVVKPDGAEIVRTTIYTDSDNSSLSKGSISIAENGDLAGSIEMVSKGVLYQDKFQNEQLSATEIDKYYKNYWRGINNLKLKKVSFKNETEKVSFTENAQISAPSYASLGDGKMIFVPNAFSTLSNAVRRSKYRQNPLEIQRGSLDIDEIEIGLPPNFSIEFLPKNVEIKGKFGEYQTQFIKKDKDKILYKRSFLLNNGLYTNTEYDEFRVFMEQIARNDNAKIILTKS